MSLEKENAIENEIAKELNTEVIVDAERGLIERVISLPYEVMEVFPGLIKYLLSTQSLIKKDQRLEGNRIILPLETGEFFGPAIPSIRFFVLREVRVFDDSIKFVEEGVGGAKSFLRMLHTNASKVDLEKIQRGKDEVHRYTVYYPLLNRVVIGIDDTDTSTKGDTYLTALQIGRSIEAEGYGHFVKESITINYPRNPFKTTNNASTAMVFHVQPSKKGELIETVIEKAQDLSHSRDTGLAILNRLDIPPGLQRYTRQCKAQMLQVSDTEAVAESIGARLVSFDRDRGKIGALSSIGYVNDPYRAIAPSFKFRILLRLGNMYVKFRDTFSDKKGITSQVSVGP